MIKVQEALKAAINCLEKNEEWDGQFQYDIQLCKAALSEIDKCYGGTTPVSEPVAWMDNFGTIVSAKWQELYGDGTIYNIPIYTSPQPRDWVGLTYKQKVALREENDWYNFPNDLIEATEAKCKQLNTKG